MGRGETCCGPATTARLQSLCCLFVQRSPASPWAWYSRQIKQPLKRKSVLTSAVARPGVFAVPLHFLRSR
jgi:hypothetical protein